MPAVSVIIPCYHAGEFLGRFCRALLAQTYEGEWEAVFVDDADSGCDYGPVLEGGREGRRFRLVRRARNGGATAARNTGLESSSGEIVLFADPDDVPGPDWMRNLVESVEGVDLGWCGFKLNGSSVTPPDPGRVYEGRAVRRRVWRAVFGYRLRDVLRWWTPRRLWRGCAREFGNVWAKAFRRSVIGDLRFDESLVTYDDAMFLAAYAVRAKSVRISSAADYDYIVRPEGVMSSGLKKRMSSVKFTLRDARRRLDPWMGHWRGTYILSAAEVARDSGIRAALRYLAFMSQKSVKNSLSDSPKKEQ